MRIIMFENVLESRISNLVFFFLLKGVISTPIDLNNYFVYTGILKHSRYLLIISTYTTY